MPRRLLARCLALVALVLAEETCTAPPTAWPATACGVEGIQAIVIDDVKYLVSQGCAAAENVCERRVKFSTRDSCGNWTVRWYSASLAATFPKNLGLVPSCLMPATTTVRRPDGSVVTGAFFAVHDPMRVGFGRRDYY